MTPDTQTKLIFYRRQCITLINTIEDRLNKMISETNYSDLEDKLWTSVDSKDLTRIKSIHNELSKIVDQLNEL